MRFAIVPVLVALAASSAFADLDVQIGNGDKVTSTLNPAGEAETFRFDCPAGAKLTVVATTPDLGAIARAVGGDRVAVTVLAKPTEDPHFVDARPTHIVTKAFDANITAPLRFGNVPGGSAEP